MQTVAESADFSRVLLVPSAQPPHKPGAADLAPATDRLTMCRVAAETHDFLEVSDVELNRTGPSYTYDTVQTLKAHGECLISWLIGADMLQMLHKWYRAGELIREANILIMARPGFEIDWSGVPVEFRHLEANVVTAPLIDISATEIRQRVRQGLPIEDLVPPGVAAYIAERGLYRASGVA